MCMYVPDLDKLNFGYILEWGEVCSGVTYVHNIRVSNYFLIDKFTIIKCLIHLQKYFVFSFRHWTLFFSKSRVFIFVWYHNDNSFKKCYISVTTHHSNKTKHSEKWKVAYFMMLFWTCFIILFLFVLTYTPFSYDTQTQNHATRNKCIQRRRRNETITLQQ